MIINNVINSVSRYFQKKFFRCAIFLIALSQIVFFCYQYKYISEETSNAKMGIRFFYKEMLEISLEVQEEIDKGSLHEEALASTINANPFISSIKITGNISKDIKLENYDSDSMILKSTILLQDNNKMYLKGLELFIEKEAIKSYLIPYTRRGYNYYIYSSDDLLTSIKYYDVKDVLMGNYDMNIVIDTPINCNIMVQLPIYSLVSINVKMLAITLFLLASLYYYVFYQYKAFSDRNIKSPFISGIKHELDKIGQLSQQLNEGEDALKAMEELLNKDKLKNAKTKEEKDKARKGFLKLIK